MAARNGHTEVVWDLVRIGADLNLKEWEGKTALMHAAAEGHTEIVRALVQAGAALDLQDALGKTALSMSRTAGVIHELLGAGAKLGSKGSTASALLQKVMHQRDRIHLKQVLAQDWLTLDWKGDVAKKHKKMGAAIHNRNATILGLSLIHI